MRKIVPLKAEFSAESSDDYREEFFLEITVADQTLRFLYAVLLGAGLGLFYDVFRILRIALPHKSIVVAAEDVFYWTIAAFITFLFFFGSDKGRIQLFLLVGEAIGFVLWYFTIGVLLIGAAKKVIAIITWIFQWFYRLIISPILFLVNAIIGFLAAVGRWILNHVKKPLKNSNILLPKYRRLLYNQRKLFKGRIHNR